MGAICLGVYGNAVLFRQGVGINKLLTKQTGDARKDLAMVLGQLAVRDHNLPAAKIYLLAAGMTSGANTLDSFGPNMSLAQDLLDAGDREAVIQYFQECEKFWTDDRGKLKSWEGEV